MKKLKIIGALIAAIALSFAVAHSKEAGAPGKASRHAGIDQSPITAPNTVEHLADLIRKAGGKAGTALLHNRTHFTAIHLLGAPGDTTGRILLDFINRNLKER